MCSTILTIGPLALHGYGLMLGLGVIAALSLAWKRGEKQGLAEKSVTLFCVVLVVSGILGAKLFYLFVHWKEFIAAPLAVLGSEGFVVYGGLLLGILCAWIYCRKRKLALLPMLDMIAPCVSVGQGFGRIGCFMGGCCYGLPTTSRLGVVFPEGVSAPAGIPLWPVQLFSAGGDFLLALLLVWLTPRLRRDGAGTALFLLLYGIGRFAIEFLRDDPRGGVGALSTSQFISLFIVAGAIALIAGILRRNGPEKA